MKTIADTLYSMLAQKLRGFEHCHAAKIFRNFVKGKGRIAVRDDAVVVTYPKRAHNPILRSASWDKLPMFAPGLPDIRLELHFGRPKRRYQAVTVTAPAAVVCDRPEMNHG